MMVIAKNTRNKSCYGEQAVEIEDLKASAKAKLVAGTPLTEEEANTIVL